MFQRPLSPTTRPPSASTPSGLVWAAALAALIGALLVAVLQAPARWLADSVGAASQGRVQLVNARGTVWQGQAQLVLTGGTGSEDRATLPSPVQWQLTPTWRHSGAPGEASGLVLALSVQAPCCTLEPLQAWLQPRWQGLRVSVAPHASEWPAELLTGLGTPWNTLQLQARLQLSTPGLTLNLGPRSVQGQGQVTLDMLDTASRLSTLRPMGSYRLLWQASMADPGQEGTAARPATLTLTTLQGALQLQGQGQWIAGRLRFEGDAQASPGREDALANLMNILGRRQGARTLIKIG